MFSSPYHQPSKSDGILKKTVKITTKNQKNELLFNTLLNKFENDLQRGFKNFDVIKNIKIIKNLN
jgi:hypothetical protein